MSGLAGRIRGRVLRTPAAILADVYLVLVALFALFATVGALRVRQVVPVRDDWRVLDDLFRSPSLAQWLWTDQNGHRMPGTLLLMYLDYHWLDGRALLPVAASVFCTCVSVVALLAAFGTELRTNAFARATAGLAAFILFWASSQYDLTWDILNANVMSATWVIVALAVLVRGRWRDGPHRVPALPALAVGAALCATFSYGTGLGVWPALLAAALLLRLPLRIVGAIAAVAALGVCGYLTGLEHAPHGRHLPGLLRNYPLGIPGMVVAYVGAPIVRIFTALGEPSGESFYRASVGIGLAATAAGALRCVTVARRREEMLPRQALGCGLMVASIAAAVMIGLGRFPWHTSAVDIRFATWSALFWIGLVCAFPARSERTPGWSGVAAVALVVVASAGMLPARVKEQHRRAVEFDHGIMAANLHVLGIQWDLVSGGTAFAPLPERTYRVVEQLYADERSMFADPGSVLPGALLANRFVVAPGARCHGGLIWRHAILARTGPALQIAGWTDQPGNVGALATVITDDRGVIRGLATHVHRLEPLIPARVPSVEHGWLGAIVGYNERATYHVHAVLADRRSTCEVAVLGPDVPRAR